VPTSEPEEAWLVLAFEARVVWVVLAFEARLVWVVIQLVLAWRVPLPVV